MQEQMAKEEEPKPAQTPPTRAAPVAEKTISPPPIRKPLAKKEKPKSEFALRVMNSLMNHKIPIIEEINAKKKEFNAIIKINSDLGPIKVFMQAKDKKKVSVTDLMGVIREAQTRNMLGLFLCPGEMNKKAEEYLAENDSILKVKRLQQ